MNLTSPIHDAAGVNILGHYVFSDVTFDCYITYYVDNNSAIGQAMLANENVRHGVPKKVLSGTFTQSGETIRITYTEGASGTFSGIIKANVLTLSNQGGDTVICTKVKSINGLEPIQ
jgi:acyl CoA:acetate/3-ketoacid CoA transferase alpha subunit